MQTLWQIHRNTYTLTAFVCDGLRWEEDLEDTIEQCLPEEVRCADVNNFNQGHAETAWAAS